MDPRSWLLVPGDSEQKIAEALQSKADALIFDLEDGVAAGRKAAARDVLASALERRSGHAQTWVRINAPETEHYGADLACCERLELDGLVLPKAEDGAQVSRLATDVAEAGWKLHAIVAQTPASLFHLLSFRGSSRALVAMSWGVDDLSAALGASSKFDADGQLSFTYRMARSLSLASARAAGVQPVDAIFRDVEDHERLKREAEAARREGFTGKLAIHPSQASIINAAFSPTSEEVAAARGIVDAFDKQPEIGVQRVGARMVDRARLLQARAILERARLLGRSGE
jgi:citrate lyase subunit beta/citryl-CoA lyase